jgi:DNA-binding NarL/FixJ family response regulator
MTSGNVAHKIKLFIADAQFLFRQGLISVLSDQADIEVCGEANSEEELISKISSTIPDILLLGIGLPPGNNLNLVRKLRKTLPTVAIVIMTPNCDDNELFEFVKAGAAGYLIRDTDSKDLVDMIRKAASGTYPINDQLLSRPHVARKVLNQFQELTFSKEIESLVSPLTAKETEILNYVAQGYLNKQIAGHLNVGEQTIKNHVTSILRKLDANARTEAVVKALGRGIISFKLYPGSKPDLFRRK